MKRIGFDARFAGIAQGGLGRYTESSLRALLALQSPWRYVLYLRKVNWQLFDDVLRSGDRKVLADIPWYSTREQLAMPRILRREACDAYHIPHFNVPLMAPRPFIITLHDIIMWEQGRARATTRYRYAAWAKEIAMRVSVRHALRRAACWIAPTDWVRQRVREIVGPVRSPSMVIPEGADSLHPATSRADDILTQAYGLHDPYVLVVSSAYPHKRNHVVIDAMQRLQSSFPALSLVHVGPTHPAFFSDALREHGLRVLGDHYRPLGSVSDEILAHLYRHARCVVSASVQEGFGLPAVEAMHMGVPVIVPHAACYPEVLGDAALYFPPDDAEACADMIARVMRDPLVHQEFARRGRTRAMRYTWRTHAQALADLYHRILSGAPIFSHRQPLP